MQEAEKVAVLTHPTPARQDAPLHGLRSRIVQALNVPRGVRLGPSLAAALPVEGRVLARQGWAGENRGLFEHRTSCQVSYPELFSKLSHGTVQSHGLRG